MREHRPNRSTARAQARFTGWQDGCCGHGPRARYEPLMACTPPFEMDAALDIGNWYRMGYNHGLRDRTHQALISDLLAEEQPL